MDRTDLGFAIAVIEAPVLAAVDRLVPDERRLPWYAMCALAALAIYFNAHLRRVLGWAIDAQLRQRSGLLLASTLTQLVLVAAVSAWSPTFLDNFLLAVLNAGALERQLIVWAATYEEIRPHQALGYLTPNEFYAKWLAQQAPAASSLSDMS